jgi:hypothetical protein
VRLGQHASATRGLSARLVLMVLLKKPVPQIGDVLQFVEWRGGHFWTHRAFHFWNENTDNKDVRLFDLLTQAAELCEFLKS